MNPLPSSKKFLDESNWDSLSKDQRKSEYESWKSQWMSFHDDEVMGLDGASDWLSKAESEFASVENSIQDKPKTRAFDFAGSKQFLSMGDDERNSFYDSIRKRAADDNDAKSAEEEISILEKSRLDSMFDDLIISSGLKPGLTSAMNRSFDTAEARSITKDSEGKWQFPFVNKDTREEGKFDAGNLLIVGQLFSAVDTVQQLAGNVTGFSQGEDSPIGRAVTAFQKANNISDSDMAGIWSRYSDSSRSWGENESHRVSSTGDIVFNSGNEAILDENETNKIIDEMLKEGKINNTTAEMAKKRLVYQREQAAADYMGKYSMISGYWNSGILRGGEDIPDPIEFAQKEGFDNPVSSEAALAYKKMYADNIEWSSETSKSMFLSGIRGLEKVPQWLFGTANAPFGTDVGSSWFADVAQTAENLKTKDDGIIGDIIEETPSLVVQIGAGNVAGSALAKSSGVATNLQRANKVKELMAKGISQKDAVAQVGKLVSGNAQKMDMVVAAMAGTQSGGVTYGQALLDGKNPSEAREDAMRAAVITSVVTFAFQKLGAGGIEDLAAGKRASEITVGDFLGAWSKKSGVNHTAQNRMQKAAEWLMHTFKATAGEGAEEGLDEAIQAFANADKDDNLADAFTNAYRAMKTGAAIGGTVHVGTHLFSADKQLEYDSADTLAALMPGTSQTVAALREIDSQLAGDAPKTEVVPTPGNVVVPKEGEEAKKPGLFKIRVSGSREVLNLPVNDTSEESVVSEIFGSPDEGKSWEGVSPENITLSKIRKGLFSVYYNGAPTTTVFDSESKTFRGIVKEDSPKLFSIVEKNGDMRLNQSAIEGFVPEKKEQQAKTSSTSNESVGQSTDSLRIEDFSNPDSNYRVIVGDEAFQDIVDSGVVRTNAATKNEKATTLAERLAARPTRSPSFSRGSASMSYAGANPNNYIIVSDDKSIKPSTEGRHGKGRTHFPTDENGKSMSSIDGSKVLVYKHVGDGNYQLVYNKGKVVDAKNKIQQTKKADEKEKGQEQGRQEVLTEQESSGEQSPAATTPDSDKSVEPAPVKEEKISSADSERIKMLQGEIDSGKLSPVERANKMVEIAKIQKGLPVAENDQKTESDSLDVDEPTSGDSTKTGEIEELQTGDTDETVISTAESISTPEELNEIAVELGEKSWNARARAYLARRFAEWLATSESGSNKLSAFFARLAKALRNSGVAIAVAFTMNSNIDATSGRTNITKDNISDLAPDLNILPSEIDEFKAIVSIDGGNEDYVSTSSGMIPSSSDDVVGSVLSNQPIELSIDLNGGDPSPVRDAVANYHLNNLNNGKSFMVVDKDGRLTYFDKNGKLIESVRFLFGRNDADFYPVGKAGNWFVTPSGAYNGEMYSSQNYGMTIVFDTIQNEDGSINRMLVHSIPSGKVSERLPSLLDPKANKAKTGGCINLSAPAAKRLMRSWDSGGSIYILPRTSAGWEAFRRATGFSRKKRKAQQKKSSGLKAATSKRSDTGTVFMRTSDSDPKITKGTKNGTFVVNADDLPDGKANIGDPIITVDSSNEFKDMFIVVGHSVDQIDDPTSPDGKKTVMRYVMRRYVSSDERINAAAQKLRNLENSKNIKLVRNVVNQIFKDSRNVSEDDVREMFMSAFSHVFSNEAGDVTIDFNDVNEASLSYTAGEGSKGTINVNIASFISGVMQYSSLASTNEDFRDAVSDFVSNSIMKDMYHEIAHHYATKEFSYEEHVTRGNDVISKRIINDDNIGQVSFWIRHALSSIYDKDSLGSLSDSEIIDLARGKDFSKQGFPKMDKTQLEELSWRVGHESLAFFTQLLKSGSTGYTIQEHFNALFNSVSSIKGNDKQRGTILSRLASHFSKYVKAVAGFFNAHRMIGTLPSSLVKDSMKLNSILGKAGVIEIDSEQVLADARKQFKYAMDGPARVAESNFNDFKIKKNIRELIARARRKMGKGSLPVIIDSKGKFHISKDVPEPIRKDLVANIAALNTDAMSDAYVMAQAAASDMRIVNAYLSGTHAEGDIGNGVYGENQQEEYARFVSAIGSRFESDFGMSLSDLYDSLSIEGINEFPEFVRASSAIFRNTERSDLNVAIENLKSVIPNEVLESINRSMSAIDRINREIEKLEKQYDSIESDELSDSEFLEMAGSILESSGADNFESAIVRVINSAKAQSSKPSSFDTSYGKKKLIGRKLRIANKTLHKIFNDVQTKLEWIDSNFESKMRDNPESLKTIKDEILRYKRYAKLLNIVSRIESKDPKSASIVDVINDFGVLGDKFISMIPGMDKEKIALFRRNVTKATDALDSMRRVFDSRMEIEEMFSGRSMSQRSAPVWETSSVNEASSATLLPLVSDFLSSIQGIGMHLFAGESGNKDVVGVREYEFNASGIPFTIEFPDAIDARSGYSRDVYLSELSSSILAASASSSMILGMADDMTIPHGMSGYEYSSAIKNNASVVARRSAEKASDLYWMGFADQRLIDNAGFSSLVTADSPPIAMPEWNIDNSDKSDKTWLERMDESKEFGTLLESVARFITTSGNRGLLEVAGNITPAGLAYQLVLPKFVDLVTTIINNGYRNDTIGGRFLDDKSYPHLSRFMNSDVLKDLAESASYSTIRRAASENGYEIAKRFYDLNRVAKAVNEIYRSSVAEIKSRSEVIADDFDMEMLDSRLPVDKESLLSIKFQVDWRTPWIRSEEQQSEASKAFNKRMLVGSITTTTASKFYDDLSKALKSVMLLRNDVEYVNDGLSGYETYASISAGYDERYGILSRLIMFRDSYSAFIDKNIGNISNKDIARKINNARNKLNRLNAKIQIESKRLVDRKKERYVIPIMHKLETRKVATSGYFSKTANEREFDAVSHLEQTRARILMAMFAGDMEDVIKFVNSPKFMRVGADGTPFYNSDALDKFIFEYLEGAINEQINSGVSVKSDRKKFKYTDVINAIESSASDDVDGDISSQIGINVARVAFSSRSVAIASPDASISEAVRARDLFNGAEVDRIGLMENLVLSIPGITIVDASANFDILQQNPNGQIEFDPEFDDENTSGEGTESVNLSVPTVHFSGGASPVIIFPFGVHAATNADLHTAISSLLLYKAKNGTPISLHASKIIDLFLTHDYPDHFSAQLPMRKFEMAKSLKNSFVQYYESKGITPPVGLDQRIDKYSIFINQVIERYTNDALSRTSSISDAIIQSVDNSSPFIPINDRMAAEILSAAFLDRSFQQAIVAMAPIAYEYDTDMDIIRSKSVPGSVLEMFSEGIGKEIVGYLDSKRDSEGRLIQRAIVDDQDDAVIPNEDELNTRIDGIFGIPSESGVDNKIIDNTTFDAIENLMFLKAESANNMLAEMFDSVVRSSPDTDATPIPENKDARKLTKFEARQLIPLMNNDGYFQIESDARMMAGEIGIDFENLSTHERLEWMAQALVDSGFRHRTSDPSMRMSKRRLSQYGLFSYGGFYRGEYWRQRRINKGSIFSAEHVLGVEPVEISEGVKSVYIGEGYTFGDFKGLVKGSENDLIVDDGFGNKVSIWDLVEKKMRDRKGAFKTAALEIEKEIIAKRKEIEEAQREIDSFSAVFPDFAGGNHIYLDSLIASGSNPGEARDMILNRIRRLSDNDAHVADVLSDAIIDDAISEMEDAASKLGTSGISRTSINREALVLKNEVRSAWKKIATLSNDAERIMNDINNMVADGTVEFDPETFGAFVNEYMSNRFSGFQRYVDALATPGNYAISQKWLSTWKALEASVKEYNAIVDKARHHFGYKTSAYNKFGKSKITALTRGKKAIVEDFLDSIETFKRDHSRNLINATFTDASVGSVLDEMGHSFPKEIISEIRDEIVKNASNPAKAKSVVAAIIQKVLLSEYSFERDVMDIIVKERNDALEKLKEKSDIPWASVYNSIRQSVLANTTDSLISQASIDEISARILRDVIDNRIHLGKMDISRMVGQAVSMKIMENRSKMNISGSRIEGFTSLEIALADAEESEMLADVLYAYGEKWNELYEANQRPGHSDGYNEAKRLEASTDLLFMDGVSLENKRAVFDYMMVGDFLTSYDPIMTHPVSIKSRKIQSRNLLAMSFFIENGAGEFEKINGASDEYLNRMIQEHVDSKISSLKKMVDDVDSNINIDKHVAVSEADVARAQADYDAALERFDNASENERVKASEAVLEARMALSVATARKADSDASAELQKPINEALSIGATDLADQFNEMFSDSDTFLHKTIQNLRDYKKVLLQQIADLEKFDVPLFVSNSKNPNGYSMRDEIRKISNFIGIRTEESQEEKLRVRIWKPLEAASISPSRLNSVSNMARNLVRAELVPDPDSGEFAKKLYDEFMSDVETLDKALDDPDVDQGIKNTIHALFARGSRTVPSRNDNEIMSSIYNLSTQLNSDKMARERGADLWSAAERRSLISGNVKTLNYFKTGWSRLMDLKMSTKGSVLRRIFGGTRLGYVAAAHVYGIVDHGVYGRSGRNGAIRDGKMFIDRINKAAAKVNGDKSFVKSKTISALPVSASFKEKLRDDSDDGRLEKLSLGYMLAHIRTFFSDVNAPIESKAGMLLQQLDNARVGVHQALYHDIYKKGMSSSNPLHVFLGHASAIKAHYTETHFRQIQDAEVLAYVDSVVRPFLLDIQNGTTDFDQMMDHFRAQDSSITGYANELVSIFREIKQGMIFAGARVGADISRMRNMPSVPMKWGSKTTYETHNRKHVEILESISPVNSSWNRFPNVKDPNKLKGNQQHYGIKLIDVNGLTGPVAIIQSALNSINVYQGYDLSIRHNGMPSEGMQEKRNDENGVPLASLYNVNSGNPVLSSNMHSMGLVLQRLIDDKMLAESNSTEGQTRARVFAQMIQKLNVTKTLLSIWNIIKQPSAGAVPYSILRNRYGNKSDNFAKAVAKYISGSISNGMNSILSVAGKSVWSGNEHSAYKDKIDAVILEYFPLITARSSDAMAETVAMAHSLSPEGKMRPEPRMLPKGSALGKWMKVPSKVSRVAAGSLIATGDKAMQVTYADAESHVIRPMVVFEYVTQYNWVRKPTTPLTVDEFISNPDKYIHPALATLAVTEIDSLFGTTDPAERGSFFRPTGTVMDMIVMGMIRKLATTTMALASGARADVHNMIDGDIEMKKDALRNFSSILMQNLVFAAFAGNVLAYMVSKVLPYITLASKDEREKISQSFLRWFHGIDEEGNNEGIGWLKRAIFDLGKNPIGFDTRIGKFTEAEEAKDVKDFFKRLAMDQTMLVPGVGQISLIPPAKLGTQFIYNSTVGRAYFGERGGLDFIQSGIGGAEWQNSDDPNKVMIYNVSMILREFLRMSYITDSMAGFADPLILETTNETDAEMIDLVARYLTEITPMPRSTKREIIQNMEKEQKIQKYHKPEKRTSLK